jgi:O-antigen/teichoic acid export membrane protein
LEIDVDFSHDPIELGFGISVCPTHATKIFTKEQIITVMQSNNHLVKKIGYGALGNVVQLGLEKLINFALFAYLARHLMPDEFGTIALLMTLVEVGSTVSSQGGGVGLQARKEITQSLINTAYTVSSCVGFFLFIGVFLLATPISHTLHLNNGDGYLRALSFLFVFNGLRTVPFALLSRTLNFKQLSIISLTATSLSAVGSIAFLHYLGGAWSLVGLYIISSLGCLIGYALVLRPWPQLGFSLATWNELRGISNVAFIQSFFGILMDRLPGFSLGRWNGPASLGLYTLACRPTSIVWVTLISSIQRVTLPGLTAARGKQMSLSLQYGIALIPILFIIYPVLGFIGIYSQEVITILYGNNWIKAAPIAAIFSAGVAFSSLGYMCDSFMPSLGYLKSWLAVGFFRFALVLIMIPLAIPHGAIGIAMGILLIDILYFINWQYQAHRKNIIKISEFGKLIIKPIVFVVLFGCTSYFLKTIAGVWTNNPLLICLTAVPASIIYIISIFYFYKLNISDNPSIIFNKLLNNAEAI